MNLNEILGQVSRTFAISAEELPKPLRNPLTISYLLLRVSDCLEDHPDMSPQRKAFHLRTWAAILQEEAPVAELTGAIQDLDGSDPEVYVAQNAHRVVDEFRRLPAAIQEPIGHRVIETSLGMAKWQEHGPYVEDEAALDDYMHYVAGLVGYLLTDVFAWYLPPIAERKEQLMPLAHEYGLALQTVNIIRGMRKDYERGWVFVPETFLQEAGLTRDTLFDPAYVSRSVPVVNKLVRKAEGHLWNGISYITAFPRRHYRVRLACMWPLLFAVKTLALSKDNANVVLAEAKMGRDQVKRIVFNTRLFGWSNRWLRRYYRVLSDNQPGRTALSPTLW
jgi:farnesyl-diphosphate farnesyltransferase